MLNTIYFRVGFSSFCGFEEAEQECVFTNIADDNFDWTLDGTVSTFKKPFCTA